MGALPKFAVDRSLGRLARWLRRLGFDTAYRPELDAHGLAKLAAVENRIVVTRMRRPSRNEAHTARLVLASADFRGQLREIDADHPLGGWRARRPRCLACNGELVATAPGQWRCRRCRARAPGGEVGGRMEAELAALSLREQEAL